MKSSNLQYLIPISQFLFVFLGLLVYGPLCYSQDLPSSVAVSETRDNDIPDLRDSDLFDGSKNYEDLIHISGKRHGKFTLGDTWTYETIEVTGGPRIVRYKTYSITGTVTDGNLTKYVINEQDTFYVTEDKMYFWDKRYQEYIMYYDFNSTSSYEIKYFIQTSREEKVATVVIDSISYKHFGNDSIKVQHVHILNNGTMENYSEVVYEGIGAGHYGIKFYLGCGLCDFSTHITQLRCFTDEIKLYSFVPYACDSTWIITSVAEADKPDVRIFPNPTTGIIQVQGLNKPTDYKIYDLSGRLIQEGKIEGNNIFLEHSGIGIMKLKIGNTWLRKKVVRLE